MLRYYITQGRILRIPIYQGTYGQLNASNLNRRKEKNCAKLAFRGIEFATGRHTIHRASVQIGRHLFIPLPIAPLFVLLLHVMMASTRRAGIHLTNLHA
ncbi:hypothetical protein LY76DRAFT_106256 [Colletotrichum caudatum]|nr:hypothetical protein LY76DRAFT_106256 [Colletotrichum caudatum]